MSFNTSSTQNNDIPITSAQFPQSGTKAQEAPSTGQNNAIPLTSAQVPQPGTKAHETPSVGQHTHIPLTPAQDSQTGPKAQVPSTGQTGEAMKPYVPESVASYLPGSDPTKQQIAQPQPHKAVREHKEHKGPSGGVGSLPGTPNEEGVARLPDERAQEKADQSLEEKKRAVKSDVTPTLPSQEGTDDSLGKTKGVGALPGSKDESGVTLLPDERKNLGEKESVKAPFPSPRAEQNYEHGKTAVQDKNMIPGFIQAPEHPVKPQTRTTEQRGYPPTHDATGDVPRTVPPIPSSTSGTKEEKREIPIIGGATNTSSHGGSHTSTTASHGHGTHSRTTGTQGNVSGAPGGQGAAAAAAAGHHAENHHQAAHGRAQHEQPHKVSVMDKIKGEAKILQGKLTKNEEDVIEGKNIMGKI